MLIVIMKILKKMPLDHSCLQANGPESLHINYTSLASYIVSNIASYTAITEHLLTARMLDDYRHLN